MRTEDAGLRGRILQHYLLPQREILLPDATSIPLDAPRPARVAPLAFADAVLSTVATLRSLDVNGASTKLPPACHSPTARLTSQKTTFAWTTLCCASGDAVVEAIDGLREVAKEARIVIADEVDYSTELLSEFTDALVPAFGGGRAPSV